MRLCLWVNIKRIIIINRGKIKGKKTGKYHNANSRAEAFFTVKSFNVKGIDGMKVNIIILSQKKAYCRNLKQLQFSDFPMKHNVIF